MPWLNVEKVAQNLRRPSGGYYGFLVRKSLAANKPLERSAVKVLQIQPHHNVLEVGFGPGHGLKCALNTGLKRGDGTLYGVDFSSAMCDYVGRRFSKEVSSGKLKIINDDVAKMALPDSFFDKVYHTNSHLYWPDLAAACTEISRVMKPGADLVTVMNLWRLKMATGKMKALKYAKNLSPELYTDALQRSGFVDIEMKEVQMLLMPNLHAIVCRKAP